MPESLTQNQVGLRDRLQNFLDAEIAPLEALVSDADADELKSLRSRVVRLSAEQGFNQSKDGGRPEQGVVEEVIVREAIAASNLELGRWILGIHPRVLAQTEGRLREEYLVPVMNGSKVPAFAYTESGGEGHRPTTATLREREYVVSGSKSYVTNGADADFFVTSVTVVRQDSSEAESAKALIIIDSNAPGVHVDEVFRSMDGTEHARIRFEDARVRVDQILGDSGRGGQTALVDISQERMHQSASACGTMMWVCGYVGRELSAAHASGAPLSTREGVRIRYADMRVESFAARSALYRVARMLDSGQDAVNEIMAANLICTEAAGRVVDAAIGLVGGRALIAGHPLEKLYRRVRAWRIAGGASDIQRLGISRGYFDFGSGVL